MSNTERGLVRIHKQHTPESDRQLGNVAAVIGSCRNDNWTDEAIASAVLVALLNPEVNYINPTD